MNYDFKQLKMLFDKPRQIVVVSHLNPDGDAVGAGLAMYHYLKKKGHRVRVILPNDAPDFLHWMPAFEAICIYEHQEAEAVKFMEEADVICILDLNDLSRVGEEMEAPLKAFKKTWVVIDHHQHPMIETPYLYSNTSSSATCELVYDYLVAAGEQDFLDVDVATCLYTGIMTDTGSFKFPMTTAHTHRVAADLIANGADNVTIQDKVFNVNSPRRLKLLGVALNNLVVLEALRTAYIVLGKSQLRGFDLQKGDTEGFVNYALSLKGICFAAIFITDLQKNFIKISFRSKGDFRVDAFSNRHFNGGGHQNAAGGKSTLTMAQTVKRFNTIVKGYQNDLSNACS